MSRLTVKRDAGEFSAAKAGIGYDFGLLRRQGEKPDDGWQLSVFGSIDSLFNLDLPGDALVNTDYRLGLPLTWRRGSFSARARMYHQSSHLGDELILGGNAPRRIDLSFETVDLLAAWEYGGWRVYGGGAYVWRSSTDRFRQGRRGHLGFDYVSSRGIALRQRLTGGVDVKWLEQADWRSGVSAKLGIDGGPLFARPARLHHVPRGLRRLRAVRPVLRRGREVLRRDAAVRLLGEYDSVEPEHRQQAGRAWRSSAAAAENSAVTSVFLVSSTSLVRSVS